MTDQATAIERAFEALKIGTWPTRSRWLCPLNGCTWFLDDLPDWTTPILRAESSRVLAQARERQLADHLSTHPPREWAAQISQLRTQLADWYKHCNAGFHAAMQAAGVDAATRRRVFNAMTFGDPDGPADIMIDESLLATALDHTTALFPEHPGYKEGWR